MCEKGGKTMNLQKLFELQRQLDEHIEKEHPRQPGEDRLAKKILALMVELGELCQEWRGFKFWSHDQKPRRAVYEICKYCEGRKTLGFQRETCWYCCGEGLQIVKRPLLEEYVDGLHFILSVGLELGVKVERVNVILKCESIIKQFLWIYGQCSELVIFESGKRYLELLQMYLGLGEMLGFTWEEVEQAYMKKNEENHSRQERGY
jgi:dimeric dUTPase (all-alpha-NTP-PPase superfamily)